MRPTLLAVLLALSLPAIAQAQQPAAPLIAQGCAGCHGQNGEGIGGTPKIAGTDREVFVRNWEALRNNERPATIMNRIARGYSDAEVAALAAYFATSR